MNPNASSRVANGLQSGVRAQAKYRANAAPKTPKESISNVGDKEEAYVPPSDAPEYREEKRSKSKKRVYERIFGAEPSTGARARAPELRGLIW